MWQPTLFGEEAPAVDTLFSRVERTWLDGSAWIDYVPGWVTGSVTLFQEIRAKTQWHHQRREMYERVVDVPRLVARFPDDGEPPALVRLMSGVLSRRYGFELNRISAALYRDGSDSVAWHRDRRVRDLDEGVVAIVSLGGPRTFRARPLGGGASTSFSFGWGDLLVMGGTSNRTWEHGVPKVAHAQPRIALMFRHV